MGDGVGEALIDEAVEGNDKNCQGWVDSLPLQEISVKSKKFKPRV